MIARYGGRCPGCGNDYGQGEEIAPVGGSWGHARCVDPLESRHEYSPDPMLSRLNRAAKAGPACPRCFLVGPCDCEG